MEKRIVLISTQNDYSDQLHRIPDLCRFIFGTDQDNSESQVCLEHINIVCASTLDNPGSTETVFLKSCMKIIEIFSKFKRYSNKLLEVEDQDQLVFVSGMEIGKHLVKGDTNLRVVFLSKMEKFHALSDKIFSEEKSRGEIFFIDPEDMQQNE
jgi:hypothetical protein